MQNLNDDARDAARWRWFIANYGAMSIHEKFVGDLPNIFARDLKGRSWAEITSAIDAAMTAARPASGGK